MRRRIQGLHEADSSAAGVPNGLFLVRVERAQYRWQAQKPFYLLRFVVLEPQRSLVDPLRAACTAPPKPCGS